MVAGNNAHALRRPYALQPGKGVDVLPGQADVGEIAGDGNVVGSLRLHVRNDAIELLNDTKTEIDRLTKERNQLHRQLTSKSGYTVEGAEDEPGENDGGGTINTLLNDAGWLKRKKPGQEAQAKADAEAAAKATEEVGAGNMLDPDTYIKAKGKSD